MSKLFTMIVATLLLVLNACNGTVHAGNDAHNVGAGDALSQSAAMLARVGIDIDSVCVLRTGDSIAYPDADHIRYTCAFDRQVLPLLQSWLRLSKQELDDGIEGLYHLYGVWPLQQGYTLLWFNIEYGDGASTLLSVYDSKGRLTDVIDGGYWYDGTIADMADDYTHGTSIETKTVATLDDAESLTLHHLRRCYYWRCNGLEDWGNRKWVNDIWHIKRTLHYRVTADGHFAADVAQAAAEPDLNGEVTWVDLARDNVAWVAMSAAGDTTVMTRLNALALRYRSDEFAFNPSLSDDVYYLVRAEVCNRVHHTPAAVLGWVADHPDLTKNALTPMLRDLISDGLYTKEQLIKDIRLLNSASRRQYLERLTSQWGVAGAVG